VIVKIAVGRMIVTNGPNGILVSQAQCYMHNRARIDHLSFVAWYSGWLREVSQNPQTVTALERIRTLVRLNRQNHDR
jgi:hypothetical protein